MKTQTKVWILFAFLIFLNLPLFALGLKGVFDEWELYMIPAFQIGWLYGLGNIIGLDVQGKANEFMALPNSLGWVLVVAGSIISLVVNYLVAKLIIKLSSKEKVSE